MRKYIRTWFRILIMSQDSASIYRFDYLLRILRALLEVWVSYIIIVSVFLRSPEIGGWTRWEALLVYGIFHSIYTMVHLFAGYGIINLGLDIIDGKIDRYLVSPMDSQFLASTQISFITHIFRFVFGLLVFVYAVNHLGISPNLINFGLAFLSFFSGIVIYYSLSFMISTTSFWTFSSEVWELITTLTSIARFPTDLFGKGMNIVFHIIPLAFIATVPTKALLGRNYSLAIISPLVAVATFYLARILWHKGLKSYESVSS